MKLFILLVSFVVLTALVPACCHTDTTKYTVPAGYQTCSSNWDCNYRAGYYCGFVGVNTYAVCKH